MSSWRGGKIDARNHLNLQSPYGLLTIQVIPPAIKANGNYRKLVALLILNCCDHDFLLLSFVPFVSSR